ncbi:hypothetical protein COT63_00610 [Candidatus Shapirobacteria bacterium CG09_land_8_20_14_0_10_38_17]|uniref:VanZ-like domain-containing protein n=1 Tax=Candidatus Shapirobacteria bacterium CG09_land_8_20_14_0_10_38_17 TaxID=1974884 RepID=A0A2H0WRP9_9BACT|nr:MAG: hypothetical protein COT63_00610 [Candidatus Shapirobacteria bacterium CG09_land_8_20_14_0_10_38_17]
MILMKKTLFWINYWFPPIFLMALIFYLSSCPSFAMVKNYWLNFLVFKTLHFCEYALLFILWFRALNSGEKKNRGNQLWGAFVLSFFWAVIDEIHQLFVPTRGGKIRDVLIDTMGIFFAFYLIKRILPKAPDKLVKLVNKLGI